MHTSMAVRQRSLIEPPQRSFIISRAIPARSFTSIRTTITIIKRWGRRSILKES